LQTSSLFLWLFCYLADVSPTYSNRLCPEEVYLNGCAKRGLNNKIIGRRTNLSAWLQRMFIWHVQHLSIRPLRTNCHRSIVTMPFVLASEKNVRKVTKVFTLNQWFSTWSIQVDHRWSNWNLWWFTRRFMNPTIKHAIEFIDLCRCAIYSFD